MTPAVAEILARVSEEIEQQIISLERHGVVYAGAYAEKMTRGPHANPPRTPAGMHPLLAKMIRDATLDELVAARRAA
jgi:hypothetical protein